MDNQDVEHEPGSAAGVEQPDRGEGKPLTPEQVLMRAVDEKATRRLEVQRSGKETVWYGLGTFGIVGWSIAVPTVIGTAIGFWLDLSLRDPFSWTLALLLAGVMVGCFNAWFWVNRQQHAIEEEKRRRKL